MTQEVEPESGPAMMLRRGKRIRAKRAGYGEMPLGDGLIAGVLDDSDR